MQDSSDPCAVVYSTTGTAPLALSPGHVPGTVHVYLEDGSGQVYPIEALLAALRAVCPEGVSA